ncbi:hypothetical protein ONZ45_g12269 [Pleurotus djamor]|nr:hypothetical protein ONZ45_g12269 [Pleurotus djamor]
MDSDAAESPCKPVDKGKARAVEPSERTPLLARSSGSSSSSSSETATGEASTTPTAPRPLWAKLVYVFVISLAVTIVAILLLILLAYSYAAQAAGASPEDILDATLVFRGPDQVQVLNITDDGALNVLLGGQVGVNAGSLLNIHSDEDEDGLFSSLWKSIGRWGVNRVNRVSLHLREISISPQYNTSITLARVETAPLELPLTANPPQNDDSWLSPLSVPLIIYPTTDASELTTFAKNVWSFGAISVRTSVSKLTVQGGGLDERGWRTMIHRTMSNVRTKIELLIPPLPGTPHPPFPPVAQLITLVSFNLTSVHGALQLQAEATAIDPVPKTIHLTAPSLPFTISLPTEDDILPIASVTTQPFTFTHPNITVGIQGQILPLPGNSSSVLSAFLSRYLSAEDNAIIVSSPLYPAIHLEAVFPAPNPRPNILHDVTIKDMRISASGTSFLASGTVHARAVLPKSMKFDLDILHVFPDVLVFDGDVPDDISPLEVPPPPNFPDPLPEGAFGHIRPEDWLNSTSVPLEPGEDEGSVFAVTAKIVDVPIKVLPGRQKEFSSFVRKVLFQADGAIAGIMGWASVDVSIPGLPIDGTGSIELHHLPFQGRYHLCPIDSDTMLSLTANVAQSQINLVTYVEACSYAILFYDFLLTIGMEVERFWSRPQRSLASVLFYLNRYAVLVGYIVYLVVFVRPDLFMDGTVSIYPSISDRWKGVHLLLKRCTTATMEYFEYHLSITHLIIAVILVFRTSALHGHDRRVLFSLIMVLMGVIINGIIQLLILNKVSNSTTIPEGVKLGCHSLYTEFQGIRFAYVWAGLLVLDIMVFVLTLRKAIFLIWDCPESSTLWVRLLSDGAIYFGILSLTNLANILMLILAPTILKILMPQFINVLASTMISRLMLSLRSTSLQRLQGVPLTGGIDVSEAQFATASDSTRSGESCV